MEPLWPFWPPGDLPDGGTTRFGRRKSAEGGRPELEELAPTSRSSSEIRMVSESMVFCCCAISAACDSTRAVSWRILWSLSSLTNAPDHWLRRLCFRHQEDGAPMNLNEYETLCPRSSVTGHASKWASGAGLRALMNLNAYPA